MKKHWDGSYANPLRVSVAGRYALRITGAPAPSKRRHTGTIDFFMPRQYDSISEAVAFGDLTLAASPTTQGFSVYHEADRDRAGAALPLYVHIRTEFEDE